MILSPDNDQLCDFPSMGLEWACGSKSMEHWVVVGIKGGPRYDYVLHACGL